MCGIVGYIGKEKAEPILINGLYKLEYRGYDSAGIATLENNEIKCIKRKGRVKNLLLDEEIKNINGNIGIAHTRWATHGKPSNENAHPQLNNDKTIAVVHNGIIENFKSLKEFLKDKGYEFYSQTDTEIIPNLLDYYYKKELKNSKNNNDNNEDNKLTIFRKAIVATLKDLKGSYAIEIITKDITDTVFVLRKASPIVLGSGKNGNYIGSDVSPLLGEVDKFYVLEDDEIAEITKESIRFFDKEYIEKEKKDTKFNLSAESVEKNGYEDYMLKEIFEQPNAIRETIGIHIKEGNKVKLDEIDLSKEELEKINKIYLIGCGTAMHAELVSKKIFEDLCKIPTDVDVASEFRYRDPLIDKNTICIFVSQSGETADTIAALRLAKERGAKTICITNVLESSITREADYTIYTHAGPEIAVASTKAYTSQIVLLAILAIYIAEKLEIPEIRIEEIKNELLTLPNKVEEALRCNDRIKEFAEEVANKDDMYFIGRGIDRAAVMEACLKLKEISYIHSEAFASGELKHGPIALIDDGSLVVTIITDEHLKEKAINNVQEVKSRGAIVFAISSLDLNGDDFNFVIRIPKTSIYLTPILSIIPGQLFAYYITKKKGFDVDKPKNLAKSVTVE